MREGTKKIIARLVEKDIPYVLLDEEKEVVRILISANEKEAFIKQAKQWGFKREKDTSKDLYLYGMDHFLYYQAEGENLVVCFQLACRSTLNGEWVPLDRKINNFALNRAVKQKDSMVLGEEDALCYLLAKCVYTKGQFQPYDIERIEDNLKKAEEEALKDKLEGVFFRFTSEMISMLRAKDYENIIEALWCYAEY